MGLKDLLENLFCCEGIHVDLPKKTIIKTGERKIPLGVSTSSISAWISEVHIVNKKDSYEKKSREVNYLIDNEGLSGPVEIDINNYIKNQNYKKI